MQKTKSTKSLIVMDPISQKHLSESHVYEKEINKTEKSREK